MVWLMSVINHHFKNNNPFSCWLQVDSKVLSCAGNHRVDKVFGWFGQLSALNPGDQVVEQEEDHHQAHRHVAEDATIVPAGADQRGETLHAATQQTSGTQEVGILIG